MTFSMKTLVLAAVAATSSAHMVMREPTPFPNSIGGFGLSDPENSPLAEDGSNYPCHMVGPYTADFTNEMALGSSQTLAFMGSAVHGGGSCQVSITYDESPTKQSIFKVIHSIEGGCPAKSQAGNFPSNRLFQAPDTYGFTIPSDIPAGKAVLAWTWFNRIGNREMYMNCAPITITGSGGDISNFNALPDIMVANIGEKKCTVAEGADVKFPNAGISSDQFPFGEFQDVSSQEACSYNWMAGDGPGSAAPPSSGGNGEVSEKPTIPDSPSLTIPGGVFITTPIPAETSAAPISSSIVEAPEPEQPTAAPPPAPSVAPPAAPSAAPPAAPPAAPSVGNDSVAGTCTEGTFNCTGTGFQQCDNGIWTSVRPLAAGTKCVPGIADTLELSAIKMRKRRHERHGRHAFHT